MIIPCFRCGKRIDTPDSSNADYIMAQDTITREPRETLLALIHNQATKAKKAKIEEMELFTNTDGVHVYRRKYPDVVISDNEYNASQIPNPQASEVFGKDLVKLIATIRDQDIQKTGIVCPKCHRPQDFVIWGVHK